VPQLPQLALSVWRSEHVPAQLTVDAGQVQSPPSQTRLLPQICEQSPQFSLLSCRLTQVAPQSVKPDAAQRAAQTPSLHTGVAPRQRVPQAPQFALADWRSTQFPLPPFRPAHCV